MPNQTPIYNFPVYDPAGADSAELGLSYFNSLTGASPASLTNKLEAILSNLNEFKSTIYAKTTAQWLSDITILKAGEWGLDTTRGILRIGNGTNKWSDLEDYLPALPILNGGSKPTTTTIGSLGQFYMLDGATPRLFICVKADSPYSWMNISYSEDLSDFRSTYDSDESGVVDDSEKLGGQLPDYYLNADQKGVANGVATLDSNAKVPSSQLDFSAIERDMSSIDLKADGAQNAANAAGIAASSAQTTADEAKTAANDAQTSANNAQTTANNAQTAANNIKTFAANKIVGGYTISIPSNAWTQNGNTWVATITDPKIPAETSEYLISPMICWNHETISNIIGILGFATASVPSQGGKYTVVIGGAPDELPSQPDFTMTGEMVLLEVKKL